MWLGVKNALSDPEPSPWSRSTFTSLNLSVIRRPFFTTPRTAVRDRRLPQKALRPPRSARDNRGGNI